MIDFFRSACLALRCGAWLDPVGLARVRRELQGRRRLWAEPLPGPMAELSRTLLLGLDELDDVLDALEVAQQEDTPELAGWLAGRAEDAHDKLRWVEQQLDLTRTQLEEELQHGR